jgi:uncharacterized protein (TIRG00374 family)
MATGSSKILIIKVIVSASLIVYLLGYQIQNADEIWKTMSSANLPLLFAAFSLHLVGYGLSSWRWQILLRAQQVHVPLLTLAMSYLVGIFFNAFLPSTVGGDVVRASDTSKIAGSFTKAVLTVFVERLTGLIALLCLAVLAVPLISENWHTIGNMLWVFLGTFCFIAMAILSIWHRKTKDILGILLKKSGIRRLSLWWGKAREATDLFGQNVLVLFSAVVISLLFQINVVVHYALIGKALGVEVPWLCYFAVVPIAMLILMVPASINGIGLREQVFIYLFAIFGVPPAAAVSIAWIAFGLILVQALFGGIAFAVRKRH